MNRTLVNKALEKVEKYEKEHNSERVNYWFDFVEKADKAYDKLEEITNTI